MAVIRGKDNIPELSSFENDDRVEFVFSIGGSDKKNSSSWVIDKFIKNYISNNFSLDLESMNLIHAPWGNHLSIIDDKGYKLKQLNVNPGGILALQRHQHRSEHWVIAFKAKLLLRLISRKTYTSE